MAANIQTWEHNQQSELNVDLMGLNTLILSEKAKDVSI